MTLISKIVLLQLCLDQPITAMGIMLYGPSASNREIIDTITINIKKNVKVSALRTTLPNRNETHCLYAFNIMAFLAGSS